MKFVWILSCYDSLTKQTSVLGIYEEEPSPKQIYSDMKFDKVTLFPVKQMIDGTQPYAQVGNMFYSLKKYVDERPK